MTNLEYQAWVESIWIHNADWPAGVPRDPNVIRELFIMGQGLAGEGGEVAENLKKFVRDGTLDRENLKKEMGDVFYYFNKIMTFFNLTLDDIKEANVAKIEDRKKRGVQRGSGDNR